MNINQNYDWNGEKRSKIVPIHITLEEAEWILIALSHETKIKGKSDTRFIEYIGYKLGEIFENEFGVDKGWLDRWLEKPVQLKWIK